MVDRKDLVGHGVREAIEPSVLVDISNVARYYDENMQTGSAGALGRYMHDIPIPIPPFPNLFFEWELWGDRFVAIIKTDEVDGWYKSEIQFYKNIHTPIPDSTTRDGVPVWYNHAFWINNPIGETHLHEDRDMRTWIIGKPERSAFRAMSIPSDAVKGLNDRDWLNFTGISMGISALALHFMHCKNVVLEDAPFIGPRQQRRALERKGFKQAKFKTLIIEPMKQVLKAEGGIETNGLKKALHICRGHFATYSEDKPLFGKYSGTFWKPSHVRGNADHGTVYKDYKVNPPKEEDH